MRAKGHDRFDRPPAALTRFDGLSCRCPHGSTPRKAKQNIVTGKHTTPAGGAPGRRFLGPVATAVVATVAIVGATAGIVHLTGERRTSGEAVVASAAASPSAASASASPSPSAATPSPSASATKAASRSGTRTTAPSPTKTRASTVVSSGTCGASFYDEPQMTANGETFDPDALTAASKTIAFDTRVRVTSLDTGKSVIVRINDRGPYIDGRCLDLSRAAFDVIDDLGKGEVDVKYEILK
ncbi:MAG: septal ring lytic transglycosylase RlpA family protein [Hamadaea sp.]|nr:septal ring lytic transglycosylase RlpA family protein [Hamadaea sp.]